MQNFKEELWERIPQRIQSMRHNDKFNNYRYQYYPKLIRGSETLNSYKNRVTIPDTNATAEAEYYYFSFYVFADDIDIKPRQVTLEMRYEDDSLAPSLHICLNISGNNPFCWFFPFMQMYNHNVPIEKVLYDFENHYLEVPLYYISGKSLARTPGFKIDPMYHGLQNIENYKNRALSLAMATHHRLGDESLLRMIGNSRDILQTIHEYSNPYNLNFESYLEQ